MPSYDTQPGLFRVGDAVVLKHLSVVANVTLHRAILVRLHGDLVTFDASPSREIAASSARLQPMMSGSMVHGRGRMMGREGGSSSRGVGQLGIYIN